MKRLLLIAIIALAGCATTPPLYQKGTVVTENAEAGELVRLPETYFSDAWDAQWTFSLTAIRDTELASMTLNRKADSFQYKECKAMELRIGPHDTRPLEFTYRRDLNESMKRLEHFGVSLTVQDLDDLVSVKQSAIVICGDAYEVDTQDIGYLNEFVQTWKGR